MKKIIMSFFVLFSVATIATASQSITLDCGGGKTVEVCTVDKDFFESPEEYEEYIDELKEALCK